MLRFAGVHKGFSFAANAPNARKAIQGPLPNMQPSPRPRPARRHEFVNELRHTPSSELVRIGRIAQPVTQEIEHEHGRDYERHRIQQPRIQRDGIDVLRVLKQYAPADRRWTEAEAEVFGICPDKSRPGRPCNDPGRAIAAYTAPELCRSRSGEIAMKFGYRNAGSVKPASRRAEPALKERPLTSNIRSLLRALADATG